MYKDKSVSEYLDDLAGKLPAPGGGSASAFAAALGASLLSMVVNFTAGKRRYAEYESYLAGIIRETERLRKEFLRLVDEDVEAYNSKDPVRCMSVPLEICRLCATSAAICPELALKSNVNLISDVAVAAELIESAFFSAKWNVEINLRSMPDHADRSGLIRELEEYSGKVRAAKKRTEEAVGKIIRG